MEIWQKCNFPNLAYNPQLRAFRTGTRWKIVELIAVSTMFNNPWGVVRQRDDEIAGALNIPNEQWLRIRDLMILRGLLRQVPAANGRLVYEISPEIMPIQLVDGRSSLPWDDEPDLPVDSVIDAPESRSRGRKRKWASDAEKVAYFRANQAAIKKGQKPLDEDAWRESYRAEHAWRDPDPATEPEPDPLRNTSGESDDEKANIVTPEPVTKNPIVTPETVTNSAPQQQQDAESPIRINNNITNNVTHRASEEQYRNEKAVVVEMLSVTGIPLLDGSVCRITRDTAECLADRIWGRDGSLEALREQARRLPYRKHNPKAGEWAGLYIDSVEKNYGGPNGYEKMIQEQARNEEHRRLLRAGADRAREEDEAQAALAAEEDRLIAEYESALQPEDLTEIEAATLAALPKYTRDRVRSAQRDHAKPDPITLKVWEKHRRAVLLERALSVPSVPKEPT